MKEKARADAWIGSISGSKVPIENMVVIPTKTKCMLSSLISSLFRKIPTTDNELIQLITDSNKEKALPLQTIEIAVNEGTTKPFIEATLTELIQNSIDASRESGVPSKVSVKLAQVKERDELCLSIIDYVGMNLDAFLYVSIPFLSTKTASAMVTGEMGSGFFNVYRESSMVYITSIKNGIKRVWVDEPVRDEKGRVVDIVKKCTIDKTLDKTNSTRIDIYIPYKDENDKLGKIGTVNYTIYKVLSQANLDVLEFYGVPVNIKKKLILDTDNFEIYISDRSFPSYLLTKGVPFAPLRTYIDTLFPLLATNPQDGIVINVKHGGYTPVQTRTRINMAPEVLEEFEKVIRYSIFIGLVVIDTTNSVHIIPNSYSTASASQLKFHDLNMPNSFTRDTDIILYTPISYTHNGSIIVIPSIGSMINSCIDIMMSKKYDEVSIQITEFLNRSISHEILRTEISYIITKWLSLKNSAQEPIVTEKVTKSQLEDLKKGVKVDSATASIFITWFDELFKYWKKAKIYHTLKQLPKIEVMESVGSYAGVYYPYNNTIVVNLLNVEMKDIEEIVSKIKKADTSDLQNTLFDHLKKNKVWNTYFAYSFPATVLIHETEHYRRQSEHAGNHVDIRESLYEGDKIQTRTFEQSANIVYQKCIELGFWTSFVNAIKAKK